MSQAGMAGGSGGGGSGTVTSFSFTDANGFDGTVTNPTTTPNLTLTTTVSNTQVMFSTSGAITGDAGLTYNAATNNLSAGILSLPETTPSTGFITLDGEIAFGLLNNSNLFVGGFSGNAAGVSGIGNVAITSGQGALQSLTTGNTNIAINGLTALTTGSDNIAFGFALNNLISGSANFAVDSGLDLASGSFNILIFGGDSYTSNESSNICLQNIGITGESNTIHIGTQGTADGEQNRCFIAGITGVTTSNSQAVTIDSTTGQLGVTTISAATPIVTVSGTTKTFALSDAQTWQDCSNAATQTLTVPTNASVAFPIGTQIDLWQEGAGQVVVAAAGGVTINSAFGNLKIATRYTGASLKKFGTNSWALVGNLTA